MSIIDNVKEIAVLVKKLGDIELYRRIVELEGEVIELTQEKREFEEKIQTVEKKLAFSKKMTFRAPFWYAEGDNIPYCPRCWESDRIAIHLDGPHDIPGDKPFYRCLNCKNNF